MVSQVELFLRVITLWFPGLISIFLERVWVPLSQCHTKFIQKKRHEKIIHIVYALNSYLLKTKSSLLCSVMIPHLHLLNFFTNYMKF